MKVKVKSLLIGFDKPLSEAADISIGKPKVIALQTPTVLLLILSFGLCPKYFHTLTSIFLYCKMEMFKYDDF